MKKFSIALIFLALVFSITKTVLAQGANQYFCRWSQAQQQCFTVNNCDQGYRPAGSCSGNQATCDANKFPKPCIKIGDDRGSTDIAGALLKLEIRLLPNFSGGSIGDVISQALTYIFVVAGLLLLIYLLLGGFKLLTSAGEPKKIQEARSTITNALIGFVIVFTSFWIVQIASLALGLRLTSVGDIFL